MPAIRLLMFPGVSASEWDNPYMSLLTSALRHDGVQIIQFSWSAMLLDRYDVIHINWPEFLVSGRGIKRFVRAGFSVAALGLSSIRRVPRVVTVHNLRPHTPTILGLFMTRFVYRFADVRIYMQRWSCEEQSVGPGVFVPHGSYITYLDAVPAAEEVLQAVPGDLLMFGQLRPNKGIEYLLSVMAGMKTSVSVHIAGAAVPSEYGNQIRDLLANMRLQRAVKFTEGRLSSEELVELLRSCRAVVLPYADLYNSGALILALSAGKPVIATRSRSTEEMQACIGEDAVRLLPHEWTSEDLVKSLKDLPEKTPALGSEFSWRTISKKHLAIYQAAIAAARGRQPFDP